MQERDGVQSRADGRWQLVPASACPETAGAPASVGRLQGIPIRARVVPWLLQLATVDLTLRRYDTDGRHVAFCRPVHLVKLGVQRIADVGNIEPL
jgi:hypothetical protein